MAANGVFCQRLTQSGCVPSEGMGNYPTSGDYSMPSFFQLVAQGPEADAEQLGGGGLVLVGLPQRLLDGRPLHPLDVVIQRLTPGKRGSHTCRGYLPPAVADPPS